MVRLIFAFAIIISMVSCSSESEDSQATTNTNISLRTVLDSNKDMPSLAGKLSNENIKHINENMRFDEQDRIIGMDFGDAGKVLTEDEQTQILQALVNVTSSALAHECLGLIAVHSKSRYNKALGSCRYDRFTKCFEVIYPCTF